MPCLFRENDKMKVEKDTGYLLSSSLLAWRHENTKRSSGGLERWWDRQNIKSASKSPDQMHIHYHISHNYMTFHNNTYVLGTKPFAAVCNNQENIKTETDWPGSRVSAYFCTSSVVWAGRDVYPTTESLDDLDVSRTGINHHVMNTTPSHPSMLSQMN